MERYKLSHQEQSMFERLRQPFAIYQYVNKRMVPLLLSDGFCELFGYTDRDEAFRNMSNDMYKGIHPDDIARIADASVCFAAEGGRFDVVYRARRKKEPGYIVVHATGEQVYTEDGARLAHIWYTDEGIYEKASEKKGIESTGALCSLLDEQVFHKASRHDFLTGLPTMPYFFELAEAGKDKVLGDGGQPMLLYIDFIGMKFFNTKFGFAEGDRMLQAFARMLVRMFGDNNCCRIGTDHFAAITVEAGLEDKLNTIFREFGKMYDGKTPPVHVGIYPHKIEDVPISTACDRAKFACKMIKGTYSSCFNYYCAERRDDEVLRQYIIEHIDTAIREKWIKIYLQPIIRAVNEQVCDVEALARWIDPEKGFLSPAAFIPVLEESGLIYKLDLYMVDQIVETIKKQMDEGARIIPHSINLSRADFAACDIVEEIRRRVDEAGIARDKITVEITESVIGRDFEFMKTQVERFQKLGFAVWMDDFGSGYSSLDVLQSIKFDLIKFDMSFMKRLDEGINGKVILTELMKMATALGVDTVCEGIETISQVRFLQEIGCSKLQGYYYSKPLPYEIIQEMREKGTLIEHENQEESDYYENIGRVNLYDLGAIASMEENTFHNVFNTLPIAILEIKDGFGRYVRSNRSYQDFVKRFFCVDIVNNKAYFGDSALMHGNTFIAAVKQCASSGNREFFDEEMPDGSVVHVFARRIDSNPVNGRVAVAVAVLSITEPDENTTYADIARTLATDYYNIFVIDLDTDEYTEYSSRVGGEELSIERRGIDFFGSARHETMSRIYGEDRESFLSLFTKERVLQDLDSQGVFTTTYRLIDTGTPMYVSMKITRMRRGNRAILGISIIDAHMKQQEEEKKLRQEKIVLGRIAALSPDYIVLYMIDPETGNYTQYNPSKGFENLGLAKKGEDFFTDVRLDASKAIAPEDIERHLRILTKENMLHDIATRGFFVHYYRLLLNGKLVPVSLRATTVEESGRKQIILGVSNDEEEYKRRLEAAYKKASSNAVIYNHIAHSLARGYTDLYYVNMDTNELIEFNTDDVRGVLSEARRSKDFFEGCERDARLYVHPDDQAAFVNVMNREFLTEALREQKVFELTYRRIKDGRTFYVLMKVSRIDEDRRFIVIAVSDIDEYRKG